MNRTNEEHIPTILFRVVSSNWWKIMSPPPPPKKKVKKSFWSLGLFLLCYLIFVLRKLALEKQRSFYSKKTIRSLEVKLFRIQMLNIFLRFQINKVIYSTFKEDSTVCRKNAGNLQKMRGQTNKDWDMSRYAKRQHW